MTVQAENAQNPIAEPAHPGSSRRRAAFAVALAATVAVGSGGWWLTHPDRMQPVGSAATLPVQVGQSVVIGTFAQPTSGSVLVDDAVANIRENTADAELRVLLCRTSQRDRIGSATGTATELCADAKRPDGQRLAPTGDDYLVLEARPRRVGTLVVDGLSVTYRDGWRRGTQPSGLVITLQATAPAGS